MNQVDLKNLLAFYAKHTVWNNCTVCSFVKMIQNVNLRDDQLSTKTRNKLLSKAQQYALLLIHHIIMKHILAVLMVAFMALLFISCKLNNPFVFGSIVFFGACSIYIAYFSKETK